MSETLTVESTSDVSLDTLTARDVANQRVLCPVCETKVFKKWPEGWDAHAEHRCKRLTSSFSEERKAEFKRRFAHLFL
jgi:hypothetical protein